MRARGGEGTVEEARGALRAARAVMTRCEDAKAAFAGGARSLAAVLRILDRFGADYDIVSGCCGFFRALLSPDDASKLASETFNRARVLCGASSVMESGLVPLHDGIPALPEVLLATMKRILALQPGTAERTSGDNEDQPHRALVDCIVVARMCAISDEICANLVEMGYLETTRDCLSSVYAGLPMARACAGLLRSIAAQDQAKASLCEELGVVNGVIVRYASDKLLLDRYCGLVAAICLRRPDLATRADEEYGAVDIVLQGLETHRNAETVQVSGCNAVRNLVVRNEHIATKLRADGRAEVLLRRALAEFPRPCHEVAYNALYALQVLEDGEMRRDRRYTTPF